MPFLLAYAASTGVGTDPGPVGATYSFITAVPSGVTVIRSGGAMHVNSSGFVVLDPVNLGRIDCDTLIDGAPPGSSSRELTGVAASFVPSGPSVDIRATLSLPAGAGNAGVVFGTGGVSLSLSSVAASGQTGTPSVGSVAILGASSTGFAGAMTGSNFISIILGGMAAAGVVGTMGISTIRLPGALGTGGAGVPVPASARTLSAPVATGSAGALTVPGSGSGFSSGFSPGFG